MNIKLLENYLNDFLQIEKFKDDANFHGLQVHTHEKAQNIAFAVSPTQNIIEQAYKLHCDTLITHHGLYWKKQQVLATGLLGLRLKALYEKSMNLLSYHLPLDCHDQVGNNAQLGQVCQIENIQPFEPSPLQGLIYQGHFPGEKSQLIENIKKNHPLNVQVYDFSEKNSDLSVAWCTGAGADFMELAQKDIFITGEISERHFTQAQELKVCLIAAGHWQTEIWGVKALCSSLEKNTTLTCHFIDQSNPV